MNNRYEAPEALKLGKAQEEIRDQKLPAPEPIDCFGVPWSYCDDRIDDFDE